MSYQLFISGGCSASFTHPAYRHRSWPVHVEQLLGCKHQNVAFPSQGNGMISRRVIYAIEQALKSYSAADIIVGIFWSDIGRHEFYNDRPILACLDKSSWENPTGIGIDKEKNWIVLNPHWTGDYAEIYYRTFHNNIDSSIRTCEHILRTQWYLETHKIKYFTGTYTQYTFPKEYMIHPEVAWLYNQINKDTLIPIEGMLEWGSSYTDIKFDVDDLYHLNTKQSKVFTEKIIWPFLKERNYV